MPSDPLGDVLALVRPEAALAAELRAHGRWRLAFDGQPGHVKFGVVAAGECLFALPGRPVATLRAGDVFLIGAAPAYAIGTDLAAPPRDAAEVLHRTTRRRVTLGDRRDRPVVDVVGGRFGLVAAHASRLIDVLPVFARIGADEAGPLRSVTRLLVDEVRGGATGRGRTLDRLAQLVLTYALRWLEGRGGERPGWLGALADPRIGAAIRRIHASVEQGTSLAELARTAGMSRTAFTARFRRLVGQPPLAYALAWRLALAQDALRTSDRPIGSLAFAFGYASESAFSTAFRRAVGCSPRAYRLAHRS